MSPVFSGGLVFEYSQEPNNFGLVEISDDRASVDKLGDFEALKEQFSKAKNPSGDGGFQEGLDVSECPGFVQGRWEANNTLPTLPSAAQKYYVSLKSLISIRYSWFTDPCYRLRVLANLWVTRT